MPSLAVFYKGGLSFEARARHHAVRIDLPKESGGDDYAMTPPEYFIASLGSCIGVYVARYLQNAQRRAGGEELCPDGMEMKLSAASRGVSLRVFLPCFIPCAFIPAAKAAEYSAKVINLTWEYSDDKTKINSICIQIVLPHANPGQRAGAVLEAASRCLLHNTLESRPRITFTLKGK